MFARELVSTLGPGTALAVLGSMTASASAAGTTQATATAITTVYTNVSTATEGQGMQLPGSMTVGDEGRVCNATSVDICLYPATGGQINGATANNPVVIGPNRTATFVYTTASNVMVSF